MADNTILNLGTGGDTLRTEDVGSGVKIQVGKTHTGGAGVDGGPVAIGNPFAVMICSGSDTVGTITSPFWVTGSVGASNALVTLKSGSITGLLIGGVAVAGSNPVPVTGSVSLTSGITAQSGSIVGLLVGGVNVAAANPVPVSSQSGSITGLLYGGVAASSNNPFWVTGSVFSLNSAIPSGSITGLLVGGVAVAGSNPVPVTGSVSLTSGITAQSGSIVGLLVGGVNVAGSNPVPVTGSVSLTSGVTTQSGSITGLLYGGVAASSNNPFWVTGSVHMTDVSTITGSITLAAVPNVTVLSGSVTGLLVGGLAASIGNPLPMMESSEGGGQIMSGTVMRTVQYAFGDFGTSGSTNQVIAPQGANNRIRVLSAQLMTPTAVLVRWLSTGSVGTITNISGLFPLPANGGFVLPNNPHGWFQTVANEGLNLSISSAVSCGVIITWIVAGP